MVRAHPGETFLHISHPFCCLLVVYLRLPGGDEAQEDMLDVVKVGRILPRGTHRRRQRRRIPLTVRLEPSCFCGMMWDDVGFVGFAGFVGFVG